MTEKPRSPDAEPGPLVVIWSTWPDVETAAAAARALVEARLAACVVRLPPVASIYRWAGAIEEGEEVALLAKTPARLAEAAIAALVARHPWKVPAVLALPVAAAFAPYLAWAEAETRAGAGD